MEVTGLDGFRLDAVKHIGAHFYKDLIRQLRQHYQKELFTVGEYWHGDVRRLCNYLKMKWREKSLYLMCLYIIISMRLHMPMGIMIWLRF
ncbi:MAG: hypothetical protein ACLUIS_08640 [Longibaculum sp.]